MQQFQRVYDGLKATYPFNFSHSRAARILVVQKLPDEAAQLLAMSAASLDYFEAQVLKQLRLIAWCFLRREQDDEYEAWTRRIAAAQADLKRISKELQTMKNRKSKPIKRHTLERRKEVGSGVKIKVKRKRATVNKRVIKRKK
jgi:hypothetical protein